MLLFSFAFGNIRKDIALHSHYIEEYIMKGSLYKKRYSKRFSKIKRQKLNKKMD